MGISVKCDGDALAAAKLARVGASAHAQGPLMAEAARSTARGIRGVPIRTGRLEASIGVLGSGAYGFVVGSRGVPYSRHVFHGTRYMPARPPEVPSRIGPDLSKALQGSIARA